MDLQVFCSFSFSSFLIVLYCKILGKITAKPGWLFCGWESLDFPGPHTTAISLSLTLQWPFPTLATKGFFSWYLTIAMLLFSEAQTAPTSCSSVTQQLQGTVFYRDSGASYAQDHSTKGGNAPVFILHHCSPKPKQPWGITVFTPLGSYKNMRIRKTAWIVLPTSRWLWLSHSTTIGLQIIRIGSPGENGCFVW